MPNENLERLVTEHLILRKAVFNDVKYIWQNIWNVDEIAEMMLWEPTKTFADAKKRIARTIKYQSNNIAYFVCLKNTNEPIGFAGIMEKEKCLYEETGICLALEYQGRGYGKEVVEALMKIIFDTLNGDKFIYSCFSINDRSRNLALSIGFRYLNSNKKIREWDKKEFLIDNYYFTKEMYRNN